MHAYIPLYSLLKPNPFNAEASFYPLALPPFPHTHTLSVAHYFICKFVWIYGFTYVCVIYYLFTYFKCAFHLNKYKKIK